MPEKRHKKRAESPRRGRVAERPTEILVPGLFVLSNSNPRSDFYDGFNVAPRSFFDRKRLKVSLGRPRDPCS